MLRRLAVVLAIAVGGCEGPAPVAPPAPAPKQAAVETDADAYAMMMPRDPGTPSIGAIIGGEWIYDTPTGAGWFAGRLPPPRMDGNKRRYRLKHLELTIEPGACAHQRLRPTLPDRVEVTGGDTEFSGCGGPRPPSTDVRGKYWQVMRLGATPAPREGAPTIFVLSDNGGVGGSLACNDMGIGTRWTDGRFVQPVGDNWIEGTAVGCEGPSVEFGDLFWAAMSRAVSWRREGDRLRIVLDDGTEAELRLIL
jgi:heat shock protein HslJ